MKQFKTKTKVFSNKMKQNRKNKVMSPMSESLFRNFFTEKRQIKSRNPLVGNPTNTCFSFPVRLIISPEHWLFILISQN